MASRKDKITGAAWFKQMFQNGRKRGKDDALDSYREIMRMLKRNG
jgi:hypothetical protein